MNILVGSSIDIGKRREMEDIVKISSICGGTFLGIYDGHGGKSTVEFVSAKLDKYLEDILHTSGKGFGTNVWTKVYAHIQHRLVERGSEGSGSTATTAFIYTDENGDTILSVANIGDSRAIAVYQDGSFYRVTVDHKPTDPTEAQRVINNGGYVIRNRVGGVLAVSRAFGNVMINGVTQTPDIMIINISKSIPPVKYLFMASDGIWDGFSDKSIAKLLLNPAFDNVDCEKISRFFVDAALHSGSQDNISVIVARF